MVALDVLSILETLDLFIDHIWANPQWLPRVDGECDMGDAELVDLYTDIRLAVAVVSKDDLVLPRSTLLRVRKKALQIPLAAYLHEVRHHFLLHFNFAELQLCFWVPKDVKSSLESAGNWIVTKTTK